MAPPGEHVGVGQQLLGQAVLRLIERGAAQAAAGVEWHGLLLLPREHFKTTFSIARALQFIAQDPNKCQLILSAVSKQAKATSAVIKATIESNAIFQKLYPYVLPDRKKWRGDEFNVLPYKMSLGERAIRRDPSVMSVGIGGTSESFHFDRIAVDDPSGKQNSATRVLANKVIEGYQLAQPLLNRGGEELITATRFKDYDVVGWMESPENATTVEVFKRKSILEDELDDEGNETGKRTFIFPDEWDEIRLAQKRANMSLQSYYCQYYNITMPDELMQFKNEFFSYYDELPDNICCYIGWDPSPGMGGDKPAIIAGGLDADGNIYIIHAITKMMREQQQIVVVAELNDELRPVTTYMEAYGFAKSVIANVEAYQEETGTYWRIDGLSSSKQSKESRVIGLLQPMYEKGKIFHHRRLKGGELEYQLMHFGVAVADDLPDALYCMVMASLDNGYWGPKELANNDPRTPEEKLLAGIDLSAEERLVFAPTVETEDAFGRMKSGSDGW